MQGPQLEPQHTEVEYQGIDRRKSRGQSEQFIVIKSWQVLISVLTIIVLATLYIGSLRDGHDEDARRIRDLEMQPRVTQQSIDELNRRLDRLESKIDAQDLREFRRLGEPEKKPSRP